MTKGQPTQESGLDPELVNVDMHLVPPTQPVTGVVTSNEICLRGKSASFVRHVCVDVGGTPLEGAFRAGQSFGIVPPGTTEHGKPHKVRLYSIASPTIGEDGQGRILSTTCKRLIDEYSPQSASDDEKRGLHLGVCSNYVCDLEPGDFVHTFGDVHLYLNHVEQAKEQLTRSPRALPTMRMNPDVKDLFAFKYEDFELKEYDPLPHIKAAVSV